MNRWYDEKPVNACVNSSLFRIQNACVAESRSSRQTSSLAAVFVRVHVCFYNVPHIFYFAKRIVPMVPTLAMEWEKYIMCKHVR